MEIIPSLMVDTLPLLCRLSSPTHSDNSRDHHATFRPRQPLHRPTTSPRPRVFRKIPETCTFPSSFNRAVHSNFHFELYRILLFGYNRRRTQSVRPPAYISQLLKHRNIHSAVTQRRSLFYTTVGRCHIWASARSRPRTSGAGDESSRGTRRSPSRHFMDFHPP
jgi:hypothetical protein